MGSWNATCGISHLPINVGDPVVAILIAKHFNPKNDGNASGYCYVNGFYEPVTLPILASYGDYGEISDIENPYILPLIRDQFDIDGKTDVVNWINELGQGGYSFLHTLFDNDIRPTSLGLWMMHRPIYEDFKNAKREEWPRTEHTHQEMVKLDVEPIIKNLQKNKQQIVDLKSEREYLKYLYLDLDPRGDKVAKPSGSWDNMFLYALSFGSGYAGTGLISKDYFDIYREYFLSSIVNDVDLTQFIEDVSGSFALTNEMSSLRIGFCPQSGRGSQSQSYNSYINLIKSITKVIKREEQEQLEWAERDKAYYADEDLFKGFKW